MPSDGPTRGEARRDAILRATAALIAESGPEQLSMRAVAERARASKETLYRHFTDRTGLLVALVTHVGPQHIATCPPAPEGETLEEGLWRVGAWYLRLATEPAFLSFYRFVAGQAERTPDLGQAFTTHVTTPMVQTVEVLLRAHRADPKLAGAFLGLLQGKLWNRALVEPDLRVTPRQRRAQVERAVQLILSALTPR